MYFIEYTTNGIQYERYTMWASTSTNTSSSNRTDAGNNIIVWTFVGMLMLRITTPSKAIYIYICTYPYTHMNIYISTDHHCP